MTIIILLRCLQVHEIEIKYFDKNGYRTSRPI
jgi:hypothetical protein